MGLFTWFFITACTENLEQVTKETQSPPTTLIQTKPTMPNESAPDWIGEVVNVHDLVEGDCFNQYSWTNDDRLIEIDTKVNCNGPHQKEIYKRLEHPASTGAPWPGDQEMNNYATINCYQAFEKFVGKIYELSELEIDFLTPNQTNFEDELAQFRGIHCYVYFQDNKETVGSAKSSAR
tara:strand:- start:66 stop:599 length:534 start_codon:yes stop_codon:yes gene_type:complete